MPLPIIHRRRHLSLLAACAMVMPRAPLLAANPDGGPRLPEAVDERWWDPARQRAVRVRIRWPGAGVAPPSAGWPVVLYSHGLGGTLAGGEIWGRAWAAAGLVVVHLQHPGSDLDAVRGVARDFGDRAGLRQLAGPRQLLARLLEVGFVLDELVRRQASANGPWSAVQVQAVGLSGHSFGAHTTLGMAGQRYPGHPGFDEPRLSSFVALSPTLPAQGNPRQAFERMTRPVLCITGTRDDDVVGVGATPDRRMGVFAALPAGKKAHLILEDADHMTFAGQSGHAVEIVPRSDQARSLQSRHHTLVATITADWWRASLMNDASAQARLSAPAYLAPGDRWERG